jgi:hypothetical protein
MPYAIPLRFLESARAARPTLDIGPHPNERLLKLRYGLWEVEITTTPVVHRFSVRETKPFRDFGGADKFFHVHLSAHSARTLEVPALTSNCPDVSLPMA